MSNDSKRRNETLNETRKRLTTQTARSKCFINCAHDERLYFEDVRAAIVVYRNILASQFAGKAFEITPNNYGIEATTIKTGEAWIAPIWQVIDFIGEARLFTSLNGYYSLISKNGNYLVRLGFFHAYDVVIKTGGIDLEADIEILPHEVDGNKYAEEEFAHLSAIFEDEGWSDFIRTAASRGQPHCKDCR